MLAALNHPNIAHVIGLEDVADAPALVMELVEGVTLDDAAADMVVVQHWFTELRGLLPTP